MDPMSLDDFLARLKDLRALGPIERLVALVPGLRGLRIGDADLDEVERIVRAMSPAERRAPDAIDAPAAARIASGAGVDPERVGDFLRQFRAVRDLFSRLEGEGGLGRLLGLAGGPPAAPPPPSLN